MRDRQPGWRLALFLRRPRAGQVKTRLARGVGDERAAALYRALVEDILEALGEVGGNIVPYFDSAPRPGERPLEGLDRLLPPRLQSRGDLGERMAAAIGECFTDGADRVLLAGTDIPGLDAGLVRSFLKGLREAPVVIGPAADGGYYLIGFRRPAFDPRLFDGIVWSSADVLPRTLSRLRERGLVSQLGRTLDDVDTVEDLRKALATDARIPRLRSLVEKTVG